MKILQLLDSKSLSLVLPFTPTYTDRIFTSFESISLNLSEGHSLPRRPCFPCSSDHSLSHHLLGIEEDKLAQSLAYCISPYCLRRAISAINCLLGEDNDHLLNYEGYTMFTILFNVRILVNVNNTQDQMEGKSASFWFSIMDIDGDEQLSIQDLLALQFHKDNDQSQYPYCNKTSIVGVIGRTTHLDVERSWFALCDRCNVAFSSTLSLRDIQERGKASGFCFQQFILQKKQFLAE